MTGKEQGFSLPSVTQEGTGRQAPVDLLLQVPL